jgi:hypothetical protein
LWGKARPDQVRGHPLIAHSLDVAAVAILLARRRHLGIPPLRRRGQTMRRRRNLVNRLTLVRHPQGKNRRPRPASALYEERGTTENIVTLPRDPRTPSDFPASSDAILSCKLTYHDQSLCGSISDPRDTPSAEPNRRRWVRIWGLAPDRSAVG